MSLLKEDALWVRKEQNILHYFSPIEHDFPCVGMIVHACYKLAM